VQASLASLVTPPDVRVAGYAGIGLSGTGCPERNEMREGNDQNSIHTVGRRRSAILSAVVAGVAATGVVAAPVPAQAQPGPLYRFRADRAPRYH
jgi:hypothetical protein